MKNGITFLLQISIFLFIATPNTLFAQEKKSFSLTVQGGYLFDWLPYVNFDTDHSGLKYFSLGGISNKEKHAVGFGVDLLRNNEPCSGPYCTGVDQRINSKFIAQARIELIKEIVHKNRYTLLFGAFTGFKYQQYSFEREIWLVGAAPPIGTPRTEDEYSIPIGVKIYNQLEINPKLYITLSTRVVVFQPVWMITEFINPTVGQRDFGDFKIRIYQKELPVLLGIRIPI